MRAAGGNRVSRTSHTPAPQPQRPRLLRQHQAAYPLFPNMSEPIIHTPFFPYVTPHFPSIYHRMSFLYSQSQRCSRTVPTGGGRISRALRPRRVPPTPPLGLGGVSSSRAVGDGATRLGAQCVDMPTCGNGEQM